jgi:hypothetical protein
MGNAFVGIVGGIFVGHKSVYYWLMGYNYEHCMTIGLVGLKLYLYPMNLSIRTVIVLSFIIPSTVYQEILEPNIWVRIRTRSLNKDSGRT